MSLLHIVLRNTAVFPDNTKPHRVVEHLPKEGATVRNRNGLLQIRDLKVCTDADTKFSVSSQAILMSI